MEPYTWEQEYERRLDREYQEKNRPRGRVPQDHSRVRPTEGGGEGVSVHDNGRFHNQTGVLFVGIDFTIGG